MNGQVGRWMGEGGLAPTTQTAIPGARSVQLQGASSESPGSQPCPLGQTVPAGGAQRKDWERGCYMNGQRREDQSSRQTRE